MGGNFLYKNRNSSRIPKFPLFDQKSPEKAFYSYLAYLSCVNTDELVSRLLAILGREIPRGTLRRRAFEQLIPSPTRFGRKRSGGAFYLGLKARQNRLPPSTYCGTLGTVG
jgi:hypothetical protein